MKISWIKTLACGLLLSLPLCAMAQWEWIDKDGKKVFSDHAPPPDTAAKNILRQPGAAGPQNPFNRVSTLGDAPAPLVSASAASAASNADTKKKAADADAARRKAMADNCERAKNTLTVLNAGVRLRVPNAQGEAAFVTDAERASEVERVRGIIASDCAASPGG